MDESAQQAVSLGVNVTIFIISLTLAVSLMFSVRNMATKAIELDTSIPEGSRILSNPDVNKRIVKGYELFSYYANYISSEKIGKSGKYSIEIISKSETTISNNTQINISDKTNDELDMNKLFKTIDKKSDYEVSAKEYNNSTEKMKITIKEVE